MVNVGLKAAGLEVRRKPPVLVRSPHELAITLEHAIAHLAAFNPGRAFTVLQVGAYDGDANDPLKRTLEAFGWPAVLVEPQPDAFAALQKRYASNPARQVFNVAIADQDGTRPLYRLEQRDGLPDWAAQLASFDRGHLERSQTTLASQGLTARIDEIPVETWTFDRLLKEAGVERVDVLQVDAEGYDFEILKLFDVPARRPAVIHYEHQHLSRSDRDAAAELLVGAVYRLAMSFDVVGETLAVLDQA